MNKENFEVLLENIGSRFDLVLEGHEVLRSEIRELSRRTDERFDLIDFKIETLSKRVDGLDKRVESLDSKIDSIAADLSAHRADTEAHPGAYRVMEQEE